MATRTTLSTELAGRLGDSGNAVWSAADVKSYVDYAIKSLYPSFFQLRVATSTAGDGPLQVKPVGATNLHMVGLKRSTSTRVRPLRGWQEGDADAYVSKTGITGDTLVWAWTEGWDAPEADATVLTIPRAAEEVVLTRAHITALERLLSDRVSQEKYFNLNVRQAASEADVADTIDLLRQRLNDMLNVVMPLPEKRQ
jgi:hypothetical protein